QDSTKTEILRLVDIFRGKIVDVSQNTYTIEATGDDGKVKAIIDLLRPLGIEEIARTGKVAMSRGALTLKEAKKIRQGVENAGVLRS
ncbi:MAG: acetolactate synthase small subunit, partial [Deltaproteobacteria bacterium]|nr:acetolactate synthase small subunit [Deltaproteobacteria bacterium]